MKIRSMVAALALSCLGWAVPSPGGAQAQSYPAATALDFLVQSNCIDARGRIKPGVLPFQPGCGARHGLRWHQGMAYRKYDWPAPEHRTGAPLGYQASDAYMTSLAGYPAVVQTFDFGGGGGRTFGVYDQGQDGGDGLVLQGNRVSGTLTEDGGGGVQWFVSPACTSTGPVQPGWLFFQDGRGEQVAPNSITRNPRDCPTGFAQSLTRWRSRLLTFPYLIRGNPGGSFRTEMIVSEHYTHPQVGQSNALERFWFARGLGKVRWEAWVNLDFPGQDVARWRTQADWFAGTQRCPTVEGGVGPNEPGRANWVLVDCRTWTNFDPSPANSLIPVMLWPTATANP